MRMELTQSQTLSNLQSLTASIFGAAAGILGLESYSGFLFYFIFTHEYIISLLRKHCRTEPV